MTDKTTCPECFDPTDCPTSGCVRELFGGPARPIEFTPEEQAAIERYVSYVEKHGHLP